MPTIHLVRHGHVHNPQKVLYGRLPHFRLSDAGRDMADAVAAHFVDKGVGVTAVIASPLMRAQETAAPIAAAFGLEVQTDERLIEAGNAFEGRPLQSGPKDFLKPSDLFLLRNPWKPSWGEPFTEQAQRMWGAIADAARANPDGDTVMVSHQLPIWVARLTFEHRSYLHDPRKRQCGLASVTSFTVDEEGRGVAMEYCAPAAHIEVPR